MCMLTILQNLVLVSKTAQFKSSASGLEYKPQSTAPGEGGRPVVALWSHLIDDSQRKGGA